MTAAPEQSAPAEPETKPPQEDNSDDAPTAPPEEAESGLPFVQPEIEAPLSYDEYFSVDRKYDKNPDDLHGHASPEWLDQLGLVVCTSDDGVLGLYREASNELVIFYTGEEYINYLFTSSYLCKRRAASPRAVPCFLDSIFSQIIVVHGIKAVAAALDGAEVFVRVQRVVGKLDDGHADVGAVIRDALVIAQ